MEQSSEQLETLRRWIAESHRIVAFTGAGCSTESGVPDFRSVDGLYHQKYPYPPETILSHSFFEHSTEEFYRFYREKMLWPNAKPNAAHLAFARLEAAGKLTAIVTQNIDSLHQAAGSKKVLELHGSVDRNYCQKCGRFYPLSAVQQSEGVPECSCGGIIKPGVVLYEEGLDQQVINEAVRHISKADLLIVGGTSLAVYPAAGLVDFYRGHRLVLINKSPTHLDERADLLLAAPIGACMAEVY